MGLYPHRRHHTSGDRPCDDFAGAGWHRPVSKENGPGHPAVSGGFARVRRPMWLDQIHARLDTAVPTPTAGRRIGRAWSVCWR